MNSLAHGFPCTGTYMLILKTLIQQLSCHANIQLAPSITGLIFQAPGTLLPFLLETAFAAVGLYLEQIFYKISTGEHLVSEGSSARGQTFPADCPFSSPCRNPYNVENHFTRFYHAQGH